MNLFALTVAFLAALAVPEKTVTGTWDLQTEVMGNANASVCTLTQDGTKLTGKCGIGGAEQVVTGEVTDEKVTFKHAAEYNGEALSLSYTGKFESDTALVGEFTVDPFGVTGTFRATRKVQK